MTGLRIGVLVDQAAKRQYLGMSITEAGHQAVYAGTLKADFSFEASGQVDAWVVDAAYALEEPDKANPLESALSTIKVPVIVSDSSDYFPGTEAHDAWLRRITLKLRQLTGEIKLQGATRAKEVWVLAASTGGPAAVKTFLSALPAGLGVGLIYVQHIDAGYNDTLVKMVGVGSYPALLPSQGMVLEENRLLVVTAPERIDVMDNGTLALSNEPWHGPYKPSVDQLVADLVRVYGSNAGLIVFSGMGDDGARAGRLLHQRGGRVWAQTPDSCTSRSMPEAVLNTGCVSFTGTPTQLARRLVTSREETASLMNA